MKGKPTRARLSSGKCWIESPLTSPALFCRRGTRLSDGAEVEVDDGDPLAGVEDREAAAGGDGASERLGVSSWRGAQVRR
jgi:hypothetical protein